MWEWKKCKFIIRHINYDGHHMLRILFFAPKEIKEEIKIKSITCSNSTLLRWKKKISTRKFDIYTSILHLQDIFCQVQINRPHKEIVIESSCQSSITYSSHSNTPLRRYISSMEYFIHGVIKPCNSISINVSKYMQCVYARTSLMFRLSYLTSSLYKEGRQCSSCVKHKINLTLQKI